VKAARVRDGEHFQSIEEYVGHARDAFWNPMTGIGSADDPGMYNYAFTPVCMAPQEATAYYSSGGIPKVIIDKKSKGIILNGYTFAGNGWAEDELKQLHDYAEHIGFGEAQTNGVRDGLIYGGSIMYPRLKQDNTATMEMGVKALLEGGYITKDCIEHFVTTDRWNAVLVPNWNVTASDYLMPSHYYIPIGGVKVATERSAIIRPNMLPYWGMLSQMGWGISDYEGYIAPILAYMVVIMAIPVMVQQMSLLFHEIPIDGIIAANGIGDGGPVDTLLAHNDAMMAAWSIVHPVSINSFGKVSAIERHYEGFSELVLMLRQDIAARSEIPESSIFHTNAEGLNADNTEDVTLKEASSIQKVGASVKPQMKPVTRMIALSCFGPEYFVGEKARLLDTVGVSYDSPTVLTPSQKADTGAKFAEMVSKFVSSDIPVDAAIDMARQFFPGVQIDEAIMARLREIPNVAPDGYGGSAEIGGVLQQGGLVEKLLNPGGYLGMVG
jgi:hypothetical protein